MPQGWKHSPTVCHGLIQTVLEQGGAPEHLQYTDDIAVWGDTAENVFEKGEQIIQILLQAGFAIERFSSAPKEFAVSGSFCPLLLLEVRDLVFGFRNVIADFLYRCHIKAPFHTK